MFNAETVRGRIFRAIYREGIKIRTQRVKDDCRVESSLGRREIGRVSEEASTKGVRLAEKMRVSLFLFVLAARSRGEAIHARGRNRTPSAFHRSHLISARLIRSGAVRGFIAGSGSPGKEWRP